MKGFNAFLAKEFAEIIRTWKLWVLPGVMLFFAVTGPLTAKFTKQLLESMLAGQSLPMEIPDPVWRDTLQQWVKNLGQLGLLAVIIVFGGVISGERKQGSDILVLTKPVSRTAYVVAKFTAAVSLLVGATVVGALIEHLLTLVLFGEAGIYPLAQVTGAWLLQATLFLAVVLLASALLDSSPAASGIGLGVTIVVSLLGLWGPAARRSPAGIGNVVSELAAGTDVDWGWPVGTTVVAIIVLIALAVWGFRRREL